MRRNRPWKATSFSPGTRSTTGDRGKASYERKDYDGYQSEGEE